MPCWPDALSIARCLRAVALLAASMLAAGCAAPPEVRKQVYSQPGVQGLSAVYSEFDLRLQLVTSSDAPACSGEDCVADRAFDQRFLAIGRRLAEAAFRQHPELYLRFPRFEIVVVDKRDPGAGSSAAGTVVVYRGLRRLLADDAALAFVVAREIGHIVGGHHEENVMTSVLFGVAAQILVPVLNLPALIGGSAAATTAASSATTAAVTSTAVASAASFAGSRALRASYRPQQVAEAENIAMELLAAAGWDGREVAEQLQAIAPPAQDAPSWEQELRDSIRRIASLMQGPPAPAPADGTAQIVPRSADDLPPPLVSVPF